MRIFRPGAIGALMDEYERAAAELLTLVGSLDEAAFVAIRDLETEDPDCRSIQTVMHHVVRAGYGYADYLRIELGSESARPELQIETRDGAIARVKDVLAYTVDTLEGHWGLSDERVIAARIESRWGSVYDIEQILEHAIVHILRHRRQIERFLIEPKFAAKPAG